MTGRKWEGSTFGGARGRTDVPKIEKKTSTPTTTP